MFAAFRHGARCLALATLALLAAGCLGGADREAWPEAAAVPPAAITHPARQRVVDTALAQLGVPYRYGGSTPQQGFDCSGLVQYSYTAAGVKIPRTSRAQLEATAPVPLSDAQPGDLVFFQGPQYSHVGIYLGAGRFVHAPQTGRSVEIGSLGSSWYRARFVRAGTAFTPP
jgi:cell wall-associated NlpC family hydrolase